MGRAVSSSVAAGNRADVVDEILSERFSCRAYEDRQVPRATIERILAGAQRSASWCNTQPWNVIVTSGSATDDLRTALVEHVTSGAPTAFDFPPPADYVGVYRDRRRECGWALYEAVGVERGDRAASAQQTLENFRFFGAPHLALITTDATLGVYGAVDTGVYVSTFLTVAQSLGVATIAQAALANYSEFFREYFSIPEDRKILCGISFGFADTTHPANGFRTTRASLDDVVTWIGD